MNQAHITTDESRNFFNTLEVLTDREIQEKQLYHLKEIEKSNLKILLNLQFWFYFSIVAAALTIIITANR